MSLRRTLLGLLLGLPLLAAASGEPLRRNPFQPPADLALAVPARGAATTSTVARPVLLGILYAGAKSLVNLDGRILAVGEEVDGYRLLEVTEDHAVFQHGDDLITLALYPDESDESNTD